MADPIPKSVKKIWDDWNIRAIILFSLSLQTFLILFAPFRKGSANKLIIMFIWSAYLLADWAANYAVGLISDSQKDDPDSSKQKENGDLLAFWPAFLLLHLGGPDTITAFALEDNELWLRHLLGLITQAVAAVYVFLLSLPGNKLLVPTILMFAAGIIKYFERTRALYLASLDRFRDSMLKEPDPGPNYAKLMEEYASKKEAKLPARIITIPEPDKKSKDTGDQVSNRKQLDDLDVVHYAHKYFNIFKGLIVDLIYSFRERDESRDFFDELQSEDVLKIIEVELNFIYEVFYTKVEVIHTLWGYVFRFIAFGSIVAALSVFYFHVKKGDFDEVDVKITYALFLGAIALDTLSSFMFVFSDWTLAALTNRENNGSGLRLIKSFAASILRGYLVLRRPWWQECHSKHSLEVKHQLLATPFLLRRWSGSVPGHNLIRYCLKGRPTEVHKVKSFFQLAAEKVIQYLHIPAKKDIIHYLQLAKQRVDSSLHLASKKLIQFLGIDRLINAINDLIHRWGIDKIFQNIATATKKVIQFLHIGEVIRGFGFSLSILVIVLVYIWSKLIQGLGYIIKILIELFGLTEVVDEIRYVSHEPFSKELWQFMFDEIKRKALYADDAEATNRISSARGDWILHDLDPKGDCLDGLMCYVTDVAYDESLLLWHIATELLYHEDENVDDDAREFSKLLSDYMLYLLIMQPTMMSAVAGIGKIRFRDTCAEAKRFFEGKNIKLNPNDQQKEACKSILEVNTYVKPVQVKGDRSKSVLFDASMLAKELKEQFKAKQKKWELVSKVWVELLSYAASHCSARTHAQQVSKGGELITFIWLLMAHFGLGEQFQINKGQGRAKLIVGK